MGFCTRCGNDVDDPANCPICTGGRVKKVGKEQPAAPPQAEQQQAAEPARCRCPRCDDILEDQSWEGVVTLCCPSCRGTFFPERGLETVLDKLRATIDRKDVDSVLADFKDRFHRQLPDAIRYKKCPVCDTVMTRKAYGTVSGVIIDTCPDHGKWVDETQFAELADFICRGGDVLAAKVDAVRDRIVPRRRDGGGGAPKHSMLSKFFGS